MLLESIDFFDIMSMKKYPVRMCIACRNREPQSLLIRIQFENNRVVRYRGYGRSSYFCHQCSEDMQKIKKVSKRFKIDETELSKLLKELETDG